MNHRRSAGDNSSRDDHVRIGDADRDHAISLLGVHFADGRLGITEYDERCRAVAGALTAQEINDQFHDLPVLPNQQVVPPPGTAGAAGQTGSTTDMTVYSAAEIAEWHRHGANPRAGIMALTFIGATAVAGVLASAASALVMAVIPVVAVLLYVIKVGPESWYTPSPRALERARVRKMRQAHQLQLEEKKAARKLKQQELTTDALDIAHRAMGKAGRTVDDSWKRWRKRR